MISILGVPYDQDSSFLPGARHAPDLIRAAFRSPASNAWTENQICLESNPQIVDVGNIDMSKKDLDPRETIRAAVLECLKQPNSKVLTLGGDHSITFPILQAMHDKHGPVNLLQLDAHPDLYEDFEGNPYSHASPFARAHEQNLIRRHVQVGIRTMNKHQQDQAKKFGVEVIEMKDWKETPLLDFNAPVYVTLDLDVLDPAFAPGISHYEPGGASVRQVVDLIQNVDSKIASADIVEFNPDRDFQNLTASVAAKFKKELLAKMLEPI